MFIGEDEWDSGKLAIRIWTAEMRGDRARFRWTSRRSCPPGRDGEWVGHACQDSLQPSLS